MAIAAAMVLVPAVKAPAYELLPGPMVVGPHTVARLADPNPSLKPEPLKTWECVSSWYGAQFDGQITANGEIYDMYAQPAAHRSLPLGSVVRVVDLRTLKCVIVRINDRGPFVAGRGLDVSYEVAKELCFAHRRLAKEKLELLEVPPSKTPQPAN